MPFASRRAAWAALTLGMALLPLASVAAPEPTFDVNAIDVDGNTLLDETSLETAVYPYMGPGRTRADVSAARQSLENTYRAKGYQSVIVEIPRQTVADGVVKLHVVEAPVGHLRVVGSKYHSLTAVETAIPALAEGKVPDFQQAQAEITEANRLPDRQVTPVIRAGQVPGTIDIDLKVADQEPLHGSLELNNQSSPSTKPLRLTANLRYDNLWQAGHSASATYEVAPQRRADGEVIAGSYVAPVWNTPFSVLVFGFNSNSNLATLGGVNVLGKGYDIGVRAIYQYRTLGSISQSLSFGADFKHFTESVRLGGGAVSAGAVSYTPLSATYTLRRQAQSTTTASLALTANLRGLGDGDVGFQTKRANARADFFHANLDIEHTRPLWGGFEGNVRVSGQITDKPLVSSEQFSIGGFSSVRGYLEAEAVGDNGAFGSVELRSPILLKSFSGVIDDFRVFTFADAAGAWVLLPQAEQKRAFTLYSAGFGTRFRLMDHLTGDLIAAVPLTPGPTRSDDRAYATFSLKAEF
ncbi:MAG: ShlB/FhaC/HecB family hemolysin secretion/activation protein [Caulobacteraceae bacterium]|nr:ShlB/FhaC/HecB family hemolysin secretion/activation protein [Caulobacteraceae bacterium]